MFFKRFFILMLFGVTWCQRWNNKEVKDVLKENRIIPDMLQEAPREFLKVTFPNGLDADRCNELTPTQVKDTPTLDWTADPEAFYTVIMTDPDFPNAQNPYWGEFLHWLVVNIPGISIGDGEVLAPYFGAGPPKDNGLLRYVFVVYEQPKKLTFSEPKLNNSIVEDHIKFSIDKFAKKYQLGTPLAINCFKAQYDDYAINIHKMFGLDTSAKL